jgi:lysophospholipid acyltransferase (LPLAT)-like uncharacterized protein
MATPRVFKQLLKTSTVQWAISTFGAAYSNFVRLTARIDRPQPPAGGPFLLAMWHGRLLMIDYLRPTGRAMITLISGHRDGQIISRIASLGSRGQIRTVTGSSSRGGTKAIRELMRYASAGETIFITPDGPHGPNMQAQRGVIEIARLTGLPILPASVSAKWRIELGSWDRFIIPYPFTRVAVRWGEPIRVDRDADGDAVLAQVEAALNTCQQLADQACGRQSHQEHSDATLQPVLQRARDSRRALKIN